MNFPTGQQIEEYSDYFVSSLSVFRKKFQEKEKRDPLEFEIEAFTKTGIIPIGFTLGPPKNGGSAESTPAKETTLKPSDKGASNGGTAAPASSKKQPSAEDKKRTEAVIAKYNSVEVAKNWRLRYPDRPVLNIISETEIGIGQYLKTETGEHFPEVAKALGDIGWRWSKDNGVFVWEGVKA